MNVGYIFVHRKLEDSPIFADPWLLKIWMWCLFKAKYAPTQINMGSDVIELERGQFLYGRSTALQELNAGKNKISDTTFYRKMKRLEKLGSIVQKANNHYTLVTVVNYGVYQPFSNYSEQQMNNERTASEHIIKNKKNNKKYNPLLSPLKKGGRKKENDFGAFDLELYERMINSKD